MQPNVRACRKLAAVALRPEIGVQNSVRSFPGRARPRRGFGPRVPQPNIKEKKWIKTRKRRATRGNFAPLENTSCTKRSTTTRQQYACSPSKLFSRKGQTPFFEINSCKGTQREQAFCTLQCLDTSSTGRTSSKSISLIWTEREHYIRKRQVGRGNLRDCQLGSQFLLRLRIRIEEVTRMDGSREGAVLRTRARPCCPSW